MCIRDRLYPLGLALAVPAGWLASRTGRIAEGDEHGSRGVAPLNAALAVALLALGLHNLPLALPAFLNVAFQWHTRRTVGKLIVAAAIVVNLTLFVGSLVFLASGQSFEQFRDIH